MTNSTEITFATGETSLDGRRIRLRFDVGVDQKPVELELATTNISQIINLLLALSIQASPQFPEKDLPFEQLTPLPVLAVSIGEAENGVGLLVLEVGATPMMFCLPPSGLGEVARSMLTMSAVSDRPQA
jgi:hypothetical protein